MKLPDVLGGLLPKKADEKEYFFSLYLDIDAAAVTVWSSDSGKSPKIASFAHGLVAQDSWDARMQVVDRLLSAAEEKVSPSNPVEKTVFGMPGAYLTHEGNIKEEIRPHLKKLSTMLELSPVGFVPLSQAIAFSLKKNEGVPPSAILVGCSGEYARVTIFRVGQVTSDADIAISRQDPATHLEEILKKHKDGEVLPSRILLYGGNAPLLEDLKAKLLKYPWPTRANFLHFPKIEVVSVESLVTAVSLAGASELSQVLGDEPDLVDEAGEQATVVAQPTSPTGGENEVQPQEIPDEAAIPAEEITDEKESEEQERIEGDEKDEELPVKTKMPDEDIANVEMVSPEALGFKSESAQETTNHHSAASDKPQIVEGQVEVRKKMSLPSLSLAGFSGIKSIASKIRIPKRGLWVKVGILFGVLLVAWLLYYSVPRATVTVLVLPQTLEESATIAIDPAATIADPNTKTVPGRTQEKSVSGEKTMTVTGKKNVGDPSKGSVTIYNKVTTSRSFPKGTTLTSNGVAFTLDSDVSVASASETIGSITFGKTTAAVTASEIGPNGNLPSGSEFSFSGVSSNQVSARNDAALSGGTSKQVTVVTRADQDALVKALTDELVEQAKKEFLAQTQGERLIDQTVKTAVTKKEFDAELDEQTTSLHGKVTVTITGVTVLDSDIQSVLGGLVEDNIPSGYDLSPEQTKVETSNVQVKTNGAMSLQATMTALALPRLDTEGLKTQLAGKSIEEALVILKETKGVAGAEYTFALSPTQNRLPVNRNNITITEMVQ